MNHEIGTTFESVESAHEFVRLLSEAVADAKKQSMSMEYTPADECLKQINHVLSQPPDVVKEVNRFIKF